MSEQLLSSHLVFHASLLAVMTFMLMMIIRWRELCSIQCSRTGSNYVHRNIRLQCIYAYAIVCLFSWNDYCDRFSNAISISDCQWTAGEATASGDDYRDDPLLQPYPRRRDRCVRLPERPAQRQRSVEPSEGEYRVVTAKEQPWRQRMCRMTNDFIIVPVCRNGPNFLSRTRDNSCPIIVESWVLFSLTAMETKGGCVAL